MKKLALVLALLCLSASAHAAGSAIGSVIMTAGSSNTVVGMSISSHTTTSIVVDVNMVWKQVCVQNLDTSAALYCSENVLVSSITTNASIGVVVPPAASATQPLTPMCFSIVAETDFYCRTGSVTGTTRAVIVRAR